MQVFTNLLANAVKFTPPGGSIRVMCRRQGDSFRVEIADTGIGIPPRFLAEVFLPFKRGSARAAGAGLGLAIVRELVERHGGTVTAHSDGPGKGATFIVELPVVPNQKQEAAA
jgi:signal transduction histidine kinase